MPREKKTEIIESLQQLFARCSVAVLTDYRGQSANQMTELRRRLSEAGIDFKVVKNTLARFAAQRSGREELLGFFEGPVAIAFGYGDINAPAKALAGYIEETKAVMTIKGGFLTDRLLTREEVATLATLPSKEVLLARVVGGVQGPIAALVGQLAAPMTGLVAGLQARIQQLEGGQ
jgi:large subunit ribosomal protein L10